MKEVDWKSDLYVQPLPGVTAKEALKAVDKAIVMGSKMGANELKAGAAAHHAAIVNANGGLISQEDFATVNAAIGRMIASTPSATVMDVYNSFASIAGGAVPYQLMSTVNPSDASA